MAGRAVLFDLDGTLLNTLDDLADSANAALAELGFPPHAVEAYQRFIGDGVETLARRALPPEARGGDAPQRCTALIRREYAARWAAKTRPYPGVVELLDALAARGVPAAVLSNKPHEFTVKCVDRLLPNGRFAAVLGSSPDLPRKPDPTGALRIAAQLGVPPASIVYLGDTDTDMATAVAAGMAPVGALWGFRTGEELLAHGAEALVAAPLELLGHLTE